MKRKRRRSRALIASATGALLAIAVPLSLAVAVPGAGAVAAKTAVKVFVPWASSGRPATGLHVASKATGYCWTESIAVAGQYRCMAGNNIFDPCWVKPHSRRHKVGCVINPWDRGIHVVKLTKPLPKVHKPKNLTSTRFAWAIQLSSGMLCSLAQGTEAVIEHKAMPYWCRVGVAGEIDRSTEPWRTPYSKSDRHGPLRQMTITQVWY
jgi:hypothetical protein